MTDTAHTNENIDVVAVAEDYYNSSDADRFYFEIWGGEDIHIGLYEDTSDIATASRKTVEYMVEVLKKQGMTLDNTIKALDLGAGYGGAARYLAHKHGCHIDCLNLSQTQNDTNIRLNREQGIADKINVMHGNFEDVPCEAESYDLIWSQDSLLHSGKREQVISEVERLLKPGGLFIFTDPMQADDCPEGVLQPVYDRIHLQSLGSFTFYKQAAQKQGLEVIEIKNLSQQLRNHYHTVREKLRADYERMSSISSKTYLDRMIKGLKHWVDAADEGYLAWGVIVMQKP
jgi:cyclopropane fatty-acyl-phospholipid synthase-like methyltransferase